MVLRVCSVNRLSVRDRQYFEKCVHALNGQRYLLHLTHAFGQDCYKNLTLPNDEFPTCLYR